MIWTWLSRMFRFGRKGPVSTLEVLSICIPWKRLELIVERTPDRRQLVESAAQELGMSEGELMAQVSARAKIPFAARVHAIDLARLPAGCTVDQLKRAGCIPLFQENAWTGIVCVDPSLIRLAFPGPLEQQVYLSTWFKIARAIDESEKLLVERKQREEADRVRAQIDLAKKVVGLVVEEASKYGSDAVRFLLAESSPTYEFIASDGRRAHGRILPQAGEALLALGRQGGEGGVDVQLPNRAERRQVRVGREDLPQSLMVRWDVPALVAAPAVAAVPDNVIPLHPVQAAPVPGTPLPPPTQATAVPSKRGQPVVLIVDDNATFAGVLERFLGKQELRIVRAEHGDAALRLIRSGEVVPDLVVCDVHMPVMNGFEFVKRLRAEAGWQNVPVVMLTSDNDVETELRLLGDGADAFIAKNEDPRVLCLHVKRLLQRAQREAA